MSLRRSGCAAWALKRSKAPLWESLRLPLPAVEKHGGELGTAGQDLQGKEPSPPKTLGKRVPRAWPWHGGKP